MVRRRSVFTLLASIASAALLGGALSAQAQQPYAPPPADGGLSPQAYDNSNQAPGRVARLAYLSGQVQFAPAGSDDWGSVEINRPMVIGDRLLTGDDGRAVLELGDSSIRIDQDSAFDFLNLAPDNVQIELSQGTLNLAVRQLDNGANFEVDTPTVAFVAATPGTYRIDNNPEGTGSIVTVFEGSGTVYGENGASRQVAAGQSYRFNDSTLASVEVNGVPEPDDFDRFCAARDTRYDQYAQQSQPYVPQEMIGGEDLYQYGQWNATPDYGHVWYPTSVPSGWAPYRYGHWAWIDPWGWTWVDNQPWGFAPFHYGRWVYVSNRWGWVPGPVNVRPVYAPALVGFLGGSGLSVSVRLGGGQPVGWFPLGPRDVYVPWFRASRGYFTNVNVTNIRRVYVNHTVINNYYSGYRSGRPYHGHGHDSYPYRSLPGAVTVVDRNVFAGARPVHPAVLKIDRTRLGHADLALRPGVLPTESSLGLRRPVARPAVGGNRQQPFTRPVVARHEPPPRPVSFATRRQVIATQHGQPLTPVQIRNLQQRQDASRPRAPNVRLVGGTNRQVAANQGHVPARPVESPARAAPTRPVNAPRPTGPIARGTPERPVAAPRPAEPGARQGNRPAEPPFRNTVRPIQAPVKPIRNAPPRPSELPSARFAHPGRATATLPRAPVVRPADKAPTQATPSQRRLPVVRPVEPAPRALPARQADAQHLREQQAAQRNRSQQLEQQRVRQQQLQQRNAQQQRLQQQRATQQREQAVQAARVRQQQQAQPVMRARTQERARPPQPVRATPRAQPRAAPTRARTARPRPADNKPDHRRQDRKEHRK